MIAKSQSLKDAVKECIRQGILKNNLQRKSSEVVNVLMAEYNYNMDISVQGEETVEKTQNLDKQIFAAILQNPDASAADISSR